MNYNIIRMNDYYITNGVKSILGKEFKVKNGNYTDTDILGIVNYIIKYTKEENKVIKNEETFEIGSWLLQFLIDDTYINILELDEIKEGVNIYKEGLDTTIKIYKFQSSLVQDGITPQIPRFSQKIALSKEIYEGSEVNGVRYDAPSHMTGWYLTSNSYDGNIKSLYVDYLYFIIKKRLDLVKYLALPEGFRFYKDEKEEGFWLDEE